MAEVDGARPSRVGAAEAEAVVHLDAEARLLAQDHRVGGQGHVDAAFEQVPPDGVQLRRVVTWWSMCPAREVCRVRQLRYCPGRGAAGWLQAAAPAAEKEQTRQHEDGG